MKIIPVDPGEGLLHSCVGAWWEYWGVYSIDKYQGDQDFKDFVEQHEEEETRGCGNPCWVPGKSNNLDI